MTLIDYAPTCELIPMSNAPAGPGWYLMSLHNSYVEAGPFATEQEALTTSLWMDDEARGVNPQPYQPLFSRTGLTVGTRRREPRPRSAARAS